MSGDFISIIQDLIPEAISRQKCHTKWARFPTVMEVWVLEM